ncbi:MAG: S8 family serine peptidase [Verrucomicrobiota bacterium]
MNNSAPVFEPGSIPVVPTGELTDSGWALARLNDASDLAATSYVFPETATPVRLYLIDTAVSNPSSWFDANANLSIAELNTIRSAGDTPGSTYFEHGTKMLSIIAGPESGGALGTPIELINYDIYPPNLGGQTTTGRLAAAVNEAWVHHALNPGPPGVICIPAGSTTAGVDPILEAAILDAVDEGLTVIVSAGNSDDVAADYIPSAYGSNDGVICVGATDTSNDKLDVSNFGSAVDFYSPGENVRTMDFATPAPGNYDDSYGTSPATALATAAALANLSLNPDFTPAELETALTEGAFEGSEAIVQLPPSDSDGDGRHDLVESFFGSDPLDASDQPASPTVATSSTAASIDMNFTVDASRFNPADPYTLTDGTTWKVLSSSNLDSWGDATGTLSVGSTSGGKTNLTFTASASGTATFLRIEINEP